MEKRGLGRGLSALIPETMDEEASGQVREIPLGQVTPNPHQPRTLFEPEKMAELVSSVREHGILQPILVRRVGHERYQLIAGERRFRAAKSAGLEAIPALVRDISEREQLEIAVVENLQREDIGAMESARAYRRLIDEFAMTQETVSQRVGKSRTAIANTLRLLQLPEEVQDSIERGDISEGHARALLMAEDEGVIVHALQTVLKKNLSVRDTERLAKDLRNAAHNGTLPAKSLSSSLSPSKNGGNGASHGGDGAIDPNEADIADRLQQALGTKVSLRRTAGGGGRIEIEFYSAQELERVVEMLIGSIAL